MMKIIVDADGCPVTKIAVKMAKKNKLKCVLVSDLNHQLRDDYAEIIAVDKGFDAADFRILSILEKGDLLITQDYGLASLALPKGGFVMNQNGFFYDNDNIDQLLLTRHLSKQMRKSGQRTKGPSKRKREDDIHFEEVIVEFLNKQLK